MWIPRLEQVVQGILGGVKFELLTTISNVETIASGRGIRILDYLVRQFGRGHWFKRKDASVLLRMVRLRTLSCIGLKRTASANGT